MQFISDMFSYQRVAFAVVRLATRVNLKDSYFFPSARLFIQNPWSALFESVLRLYPGIPACS